MEELDPRQIEFLKNYLDPKSETFSNATQSALKAGYSQEYSENITSLMPKWLSENIGDSQLINQALQNLRYLLVGEDDKIKSDLTKFVLERLNKKKFSQRQELTGEDGKALIIEVSEAIANKNDINPQPKSDSE